MGGRRTVDLDLRQLEQLAAIACTQEDAAAVMGIVRTTFSRKLRQRKYRDAWERGQAAGRVSLRRRQWKKNSDTMLIWLGKQILGQSDRPEIADGGRSAAEEYLITQKGKALK